MKKDKKEIKKVLFAGLGRMGFPMAAHLAKNEKINVSIYNRSQKKMDQWLNDNIGSALTKTEIFDAVVLCLGDDQSVQSALLGELNLINQIKPNGYIIDHTTTSAMLAKKMYQEAKTRHIDYLDAPVSGGEAGAINGVLSCMIGGDKQKISQIEYILAQYCKSITHVGENGAGQTVKMANQLCSAGVLAGLSEALMLLEKSDIDIQAALLAIQGGAAQSWQMENRFQTMANREFDFGFAIDHMIKDLQYALAHTEHQGWDASISKKILQDYQTLSEKGDGNLDTSSLVKQYEGS